jgi:hypothetical protein
LLSLAADKDNIILMNQFNHELTTFIENKIGLKIEDSIEQHDDFMQIIINRIASYLEQLLITNKNKLFDILYRIDINEEKIYYALNLKPHQASLFLAKTIIERQYQKIKTQAEYKKNQDF